MSEILCKWLNEDVNLSTNINPSNFAGSFSNGYLLGELFYRYGLQDDFALFSSSSISESKLNNFSLLQPTMSLLEIKFDTNTANEIIRERAGTITRVLYQLFIALNKKERRNLTNIAMESMRSTGTMQLGEIKTDIFKKRLKTLVPRQVDLDFQKVQDKYQEKQNIQEEKARLARIIEEEKLQEAKQKIRKHGLERSRKIREKQEEVMTRIREAVVPKPPTSPPKKVYKTNRHSKTEEAKKVYEDIERFENGLKKGRNLSPIPSSELRPSHIDIESYLVEEQPKTNYKDLVKPSQNVRYISEIRQCLNENTNARKEREKRRRMLIVEQMKSHKVEAEKQQEEALVARLMRKSQMEKRIAVQLMDVKKAKATIKNNRLELEKQFKERRQRDFQDALNREAALCWQAKIEYAEEIEKQKQIHQEIARQRRQAKYEKHYQICKQMVLDITDLSCRMVEYRTLTEHVVPPKIERELKTLFLHSKPLYAGQELSEEDSRLALVEEEKQKILDEIDFNNYKNFSEEWMGKEAPSNNHLLGFILKRMNDILFPPTPPPEIEAFPFFPIKACVLGKVFSGKTTALKSFAERHPVNLLRIDVIIQEAVEAWERKDVLTPPPVPDHVEPESVQPSDNNVPQEAEELKTEDTSPGADEVSNEQNIFQTEPPVDELSVKTATPVEISKDNENKKHEDNGENTERQQIVEEEVKPQESIQYTQEALFGEQIVQHLKAGEEVPDELVVDVLLLKIRSLEVKSGWLLDGFPSTLLQAQLFEKSLTGYESLPSPQKVKDAKKTGRKSKLAQDPTPPSETKAPTSGIDVVILLEVEDEIALKRAEGRTVDGNNEYHQENNPPEEGAYTGIQGSTKIQPLVDSSFDREQIQTRLTNFKDNFVQLEKWFNIFNNLKRVDAALDKDCVITNVHSLLEQTLEKTTDSHTIEEQDDENNNNEASEKLEGDPDLENNTANEEGDKVPSPAHQVEEEKEVKEADPLDATTWTYIDHPIQKELVGILQNSWDNIEDSYLKACKHVFRKIRQENDVIYKYFYDRRKWFIEFLKRPDEKQVFVTQWQKEYNNFPDDMRNDAECKDELCQRVDDLCDTLWNICDTRKEEAEKERMRIIDEGWLPDHIALLGNHYLSLMQTEADRFLNAVKFFRDYYTSMQSEQHRVKPDTSISYTRLQLIDISMKLTKEEKHYQHQDSEDGREENTKSVAENRIPLVAQKQKRSTSSARSGEHEDHEREDQHEIKLLNEAANAVVGCIETQEAFELCELVITAETTNKRAASVKKGQPKDNKKKSPTKISKTPIQSTPEINNEELELKHEEEKRSKQRNKEYMAAVHIEGEGLKARIEEIRCHAINFIVKLKGKAEKTYSDMDDWLGKRFLGEMECINNMSELLKESIERETKLQNAVVLDDNQFFIDDDMHLFNTPTPPRSLTPIEQPINNMFTCAQLSDMCKQLKELSPNGVLTLDAFNRANIPHVQTSNVAAMLTTDNEHVNWKRFLVSLAIDPPATHEQLYAMLCTFIEFDASGTGVVTREDFAKVKFWFEEDSFEENYKLKQLLFEIFSANGDIFSYKDMLLYLPKHDDPLYGLLVAFCLAGHQPPPAEDYILHEGGDTCENTEGEEIKVTVDQLLTVLLHGDQTTGACDRFNMKANQASQIREILETAFHEICETEDYVTFKSLCNHPEAVEVLASCKKYTKCDILSILQKDEVKTEE